MDGQRRIKAVSVYPLPLTHNYLLQCDQNYKLNRLHDNYPITPGQDIK